EVLALVPASAEYPFTAARQLFEKLPAGDSRRVIAFGRAAEAYSRRPVGPFPEMLAHHWKEVPQSLAQSALGIVVNAVRTFGDETRSAESYTTEKGTVKLSSRQSVELFHILGALRALAPKQLEEILTAYPDLRAAVQMYPEGRLSMDAQQ